jgi:hypothetical protein
VKRSSRRLAAVAVAATFVAVGLLHRAALVQVRDAEAAYVEARRVTACATARLTPFAESGRDLDELPEALEEILTDARAELVQTRERTPRGAALYPRATTALRSVRAAIIAQVALYDAMVADPDGSGDELTALGQANRTAEARLEEARNAMFIGPGAGWSSRNACGRR